MTSLSRVVESTLIPSTGVPMMVRWVDRKLPIEVSARGELLYFTPEQAHLLGSALLEHAQACGYDPEKD